MLDDKTVEALKQRYSHIHPLLFHRSKERAKSVGDLFDMLDTMPPVPVVWEESSCRWVATTDLLQSRDFSLIQGRKKSGK